MVAVVGPDIVACTPLTTPPSAAEITLKTTESNAGQ